MKKILALIVIGVIGYFSYGHYMNNNVDSTDKLTFTDMVNLSKKAVLSEVPGSDFYIATTLPGVRMIEAIYRGNDSCPSVAVTVTDDGKTKVEKQSSPWMECVVNYHLK
jgi:hypothetical protein